MKRMLLIFSCLVFCLPISSQSITQYIENITSTFKKIDSTPLDVQILFLSSNTEMICNDNGLKYRVLAGKNTGDGDQIIIYNNNNILCSEFISPFGIGLEGISKFKIDDRNIILHGIRGGACGKGVSISVFELLLINDNKVQIIRLESFFSHLESFIIINGQLGFICFDRQYCLDYDCLIPNIFIVNNGNFQNISKNYKLPIYDIESKNVLTSIQLNTSKYKSLSEYVYKLKPYLWSND